MFIKFYEWHYKMLRKKDLSESEISHSNEDKNFINNDMIEKG